MRPVNLTPPEDRDGDVGIRRAGGLSNLVLAGLALALLGIVVVAFTSKQISDKKADVSGLEQELASAQAKATALKPFADFRGVQEAREGTVASLAQSRFDWERVMRELSLILPDDVWLINLTGTVLPDVTVDNSSQISQRADIQGPALEIVGCAPSQDAVAGFVAALEDIDGVTRVGVVSSELANGASGSSSGTESDTDCRTRDFISKFEIVVAFDAVPAPAGAVSPPPSVPAPLAPSSGTGELADAQAQEAQTAQSVAEQSANAKKATQTFIPGN